jgi:hypothetical protein
MLICKIVLIKINQETIEVINEWNSATALHFSKVES